MMNVGQAHVHVTRTVLLVQVPGRMRLIALAAVLRSQCGAEKGPEGAKGVVFLSSCAGVDFHHAVLGRVYEGVMEEPLLPCPLFRLHGNLAQVTLRPVIDICC